MSHRGRPPKGTLPRKVTITFDFETAEMLGKYHSSLAHDGVTGPIQSTICDLVRQALAGDPLSGAIHSARVRAFHEGRIWVITRINQATREIASELSVVKQDAESSLIQLMEAEHGNQEG